MLKFLAGLALGAWLGFSAAAFAAVRAGEKRRER